jgi:hypothetical protein
LPARASSQHLFLPLFLCFVVVRSFFLFRSFVLSLFRSFVLLSRSFVLSLLFLLFLIFSHAPTASAADDTGWMDEPMNLTNDWSWATSTSRTLEVCVHVILAVFIFLSLEVTSLLLFTQDVYRSGLLVRTLWHLTTKRLYGIRWFRKYGTGCVYNVCFCQWTLPISWLLFSIHSQRQRTQDALFIQRWTTWYVFDDRR